MCYHYLFSFVSFAHSHFDTPLYYSLGMCMVFSRWFGKQFSIYVMAQHSVIQIGIQKDLNFNAFQEQPSEFRWGRIVWSKWMQYESKASIHNISCNNFSDILLQKQCRHFRKMDFSFHTMSLCAHASAFEVFLIHFFRLICLPLSLKWTCKFIQ